MHVCVRHICSYTWLCVCVLVYGGVCVSVIYNLNWEHLPVKRYRSSHPSLHLRPSQALSLIRSMSLALSLSLGWSRVLWIITVWRQKDGRVGGGRGSYDPPEATEWWRKDTESWGLGHITEWKGKRAWRMKNRKLESVTRKRRAWWEVTGGCWCWWE